MGGSLSKASGSLEIPAGEKNAGVSLNRFSKFPVRLETETLVFGK